MFAFEDRFTRHFPVDSATGREPRTVQNALYARVEPERVSNPKLLLWSDEVAALLGLPVDAQTSETVLNVLAGNAVVDGSVPYATVYGGHQFGHWAGQLGDGRAINLGEIGDFTLQLKGAGRTPFSRHADGRAVLRSSIREFLCSEAMHHLGIPTTRALSLVGTDSTVVRDMFYDGHPEQEPCALVCRVSKSFLRFGHFELLDEPAQIPGFDALLEYQDHKPFECVGEGRESRAAMAALAQSPSWREDAIVRRFADEILPQLDASELPIAPLLVPVEEHAIPESLWTALRESFRA